MDELIRKYVDLPNHANNKGWFVVKCEVCNDYKPRGGFRITDTETNFHCFNCSTKATYFKDSYVSDDMKLVLKSFGIPDDEIQKLNFKAFGSKKTHTKKPVQLENPIVEIPLPSSFYKVKTDGLDKWSNVALEYLDVERGIINDYNFFLSAGKTTEFEKKWYGRLIIPFYREGKLIFYQGRSFVNNKRKYENAPITGNSVILYGYDQLYANHDEPLFITEGFFDSYHLKGVAINGNELTPGKIKVINQSRRRKIYIPDRFGNGKQAALNAIDAGWDVSVPDTGDCKDINESILRFGYMYVYKSLLQNAKKGFEAKVCVNLICK